MSALGPRMEGTPSARANSRDMRAFAQGIRRIVLEQSMRAGVGHIGSALSVADIVAALYADVLDTVDPRDPDRDRFVLSKGHASLALYAALYLRDWLTHDELSTYCADGTRLGTHPEAGVPGIDFATGSLGHGLSLAAGAALAGRLQRLDAAGVLPAQRRRVQRGIGLGGRHVRRAPPPVESRRRSSTSTGSRRSATRRTCSISRRWRSAGARSAGTPTRSTGTTRSRSPTPSGRSTTEAGPPHVLVAHTVFGKGVSFMERSIEWHYLPMTEGQFERAIEGGGGVRATFVRTLVELAEEDERIVLLTGDLGFTVVEPFAERFPDRFFNVGVAEQNMVGVATGLAEAGFVPFVVLDRDLRDAPVVRVHPQRAGAAPPAGADRRRRRRARVRDERADALRARGHRRHARPARDDGARAGGLPAGPIGADREPRRVRPRLLQARQERDRDGAGARRRLRLGGVEQIGAGRDVAIVATGSITHQAARGRRAPRGPGLDARASWSPPA